MKNLPNSSFALFCAFALFSSSNLLAVDFTFNGGDWSNSSSWTGAVVPWTSGGEADVTVVKKSGDVAGVMSEDSTATYASDGKNMFWLGNAGNFTLTNQDSQTVNTITTNFNKSVTLISTLDGVGDIEFNQNFIFTAGSTGANAVKIQHYGRNDLVFNSNITLTNPSSFSQVGLDIVAPSSYKGGTVVLNGILNLGGKYLQASPKSTVKIEGSSSNIIDTVKAVYGGTFILNKSNGAIAGNRLELRNESTAVFKNFAQLKNTADIYLADAVVKTKISGRIVLDNSLVCNIADSTKIHDYNGVNLANSNWNSDNNAWRDGVSTRVAIDFQSPTSGTENAAIIRLRRINMSELRLYDKWGSGAVEATYSDANKQNYIAMWNDSGVVVENFNPEIDMLLIRDFLVRTEDAPTGKTITDGRDYIWFDGIGERGVDYEVVILENIDGYNSYSYNLIPEPSTFALFSSLLITAICIIKRRKNNNSIAD